MSQQALDGMPEPPAPPEPPPDPESPWQVWYPFRVEQHVDFRANVVALVRDYPQEFLDLADKILEGNSPYTEAEIPVQFISECFLEQMENLDAPMLWKRVRDDQKWPQVSHVWVGDPEIQDLPRRKDHGEEPEGLVDYLIGLARDTLKQRRAEEAREEYLRTQGYV